LLPQSRDQTAGAMDRIQGWRIVAPVLAPANELTKPRSVVRRTERSAPCTLIPLPDDSSVRSPPT